MGDWGIDPDVALFIGGPKDGQIENVRGNRQQRYVIADDTFEIRSFADPMPMRMPHYRYGTYEHATVVGGGQVYSVMADRQENSLQEISDRVTYEVMYGAYPSRYVGNGWGSSGYHNHWALSSQLASLYYMDDYQKPKKSKEEALAWLNQTEGKDFL